MVRCDRPPHTDARGKLRDHCVARNSVYDAFGEPAQPAIYFSYRECPMGQGEIHLRRAARNETALTPKRVAVLRDLDPMLPLYDVRTLPAHANETSIFAAFPRACSPSRATPARPRGDRNLRRGFPTPWPGERENWRAANVRGHQRAGRPTNYSRELGAITWGTGDRMASCPRDFPSRFPERPLSLSVFVGVPALLVECRSAGLPGFRAQS